MKLACCVWALTGSEQQKLRQASDLGFGCIDVQPQNLRGAAARQAARELGLAVSCLGGSFGMPAGASLDNADGRLRAQALAHVSEAIRQAASLNAGTIYLVPGNDDSRAALSRFGDSLLELAETAAALQIKLALEHFPGAALPSAQITLDYINSLEHRNLYLLYDSGHIQMTAEDPARVIGAAGDRLGYVHFDDNDGIGDWHWALLDGVMSEETLRDTLRALADIDYRGALSLELSPALEDPAAALAKSRQILLAAGQALRLS